MIRRNPPAALRVRVERPFYYLGRVQTAGAELELPRGIALEVIASHKATAVPAVEPKAEAPAPAAPQPPAEAPKAKGGKDAA